MKKFQVGDVVNVKDYISYNVNGNFVGIIVKIDNEEIIVKIDNEDYIGQNLFIYNFENNQIWNFDSCFAKIERL